MTQITCQSLNVQSRPARLWSGGQGSALLLIHGGMGDARLHWEPVWEALAQTFTVAAPDLPGFGATAPLPTSSFEGFANWTVALMDTLGWPTAALVGNSFGGGVARLAAAAYPARITRLVLANGGFLPSVPALLKTLLRQRWLSDWMMDMMRAQVFSRNGLKQLMGDERFLTPDFVARSQAESRGFVGAMREAAFAGGPPLKTPSAPTLILWGQRDRFAPLKRGRTLISEMPRAEWQEVPNAGHLPQLEQPAEFVAAVRAFCA